MDLLHPEQQSIADVKTANPLLGRNGLLQALSQVCCNLQNHQKKGGKTHWHLMKKN
jgi:hypothetical protein